MSVYGSTFFNEQTMRRPLRFLRRMQAARTEFRDPPRVAPVRHRSPEPMRAVLQPRHVNPISMFCAQAHVQTAAPRRAVLGVAVVAATDITPEERADAATYFEAVDAYGAAWMEGFCAPPFSADPARLSSTPGVVSCGRSAISAVGNWLTSRSLSDQPRGISRNDSERREDAEDTELPAFASAGAAKVARRQDKKRRGLSYDAAGGKMVKEESGKRVRHNRETSATSATHCHLNNTTRAPPQGCGKNASCEEAALSSQPLPSDNSRVKKQKAATAKKQHDEATIVFSDPCVAAMPISAVTAFAAAFQREQHGVVVRAVLPRRGGQSRAVAGASGAAAASFHAPHTPSALVDAIAAHALAVVSAAQGSSTHVLDQAVVLTTDGVNDHVQQCAQEAKTSQRPRFRRRSSLEVYGRGAYTVVDGARASSV